MSKKPKTIKKADKENDLWISPRFLLKGANGERAWENRRGGAPHSSRYLEMADVALGLKKPSPKKAKSKTVHDTTKKEPYTK
jgi:hypothetical protein